MSTEKVLSKTAIERKGKEVEMLGIVDALVSADIPIERVNDFGTLAYMVKDGPLEGRFVTIKVVLAKEFNDETLTGFDIEEAINEYALKVTERKEAAAKAQAKALAKANKVKTKAKKE